MINVFNQKNMKKLILVRHAKSSWTHNVIDHERPLNSKGLLDSALIANFLEAKQFKIDFVMVSDAFRTKQTSEIILPKLNINSNKIVYDHNLYDFSGDLLTQTIKKCDNSVKTLMVFGHNHAITAFVNTYGSLFIDNVPTCGVVTITFNTNNWEQIKKGQTTQTLFPKDLRG